VSPRSPEDRLVLPLVYGTDLSDAAKPPRLIVLARHRSDKTIERALLDLPTICQTMLMKAHLRASRCFRKMHIADV